MPDWSEILQAPKSASTLLVLFVPSVDRYEVSIDQEYWVTETLTVFGHLFGGATAFPQGRGVWRDDDRGGQLIFDAPVIVQCYTTEQALKDRAEALRRFLTRLGQEGRQGPWGSWWIEIIWRSASLSRSRNGQGHRRTGREAWCHGGG